MDERHATSLLTFAEEARQKATGADAQSQFRLLEERYGDVRAAFDWFVAQRRADEAFRLAGSLVPFWMAQKRLADGSAWFDEALALSGGNSARRARALYDAGYVVFWTGDDKRSAALQKKSVALARQIGDPTVTALALVGLARIALRTDADEARRLCREALAATEGTDDRVGRSSAMHVLGVAAQMAGDFEEARRVMADRIAIARETGNLAVIASESGNLSMVERQLGNLDRAKSLAREALEIAVQRGDGQAIPWFVNGLAAVARDRGQFERAATLVGVADETMDAAGGAWPPDELEHYEATVATLVRETGAEPFEGARAAGRAMETSLAIAFALRGEP